MIRQQPRLTYEYRSSGLNGSKNPSCSSSSSAGLSFRFNSVGAYDRLRPMCSQASTRKSKSSRDRR